jgi:hypothetical protein
MSEMGGHLRRFWDIRATSGYGVISEERMASLSLLVIRNAKPFGFAGQATN